MRQSQSLFMRLAEATFSAATAEEAGEAFLSTTRPIGAVYLQTRVYRRPSLTLTSASHWQAGGVISRIARPGWVGSSAFNYICFDQNPLLTAIRESHTRYRFSDFAPHASPKYGAYWEALSESGMAEGLCATSYGAGGKIASLHLGVAQYTLSPADAAAIQSAGLVLTERLIDMIDPPTDDPIPLTPRECDVMRYVGEGKTDWEIGVILGISEATAHFHINNARRKLGAVNRAQAIAKLAIRRLL